ncbi:MAG: HTH domain-containing protein [Candidatus Zixiibacteriota bacterium]|nr:MAG: HTH domain-containing protein [candidate division Zixibacteria bacterium]
MTKAERLLFLVNLFRVRRRVSLEELARECEVSTRTIYRDLVSLSSLNIPIYYDGGYRLAKGISLPPLSFTRDEQEVIGYCLRNSPLIRSPRLRGAIRNIELKILSALKDKKKGQLNCLLICQKQRANRFSRRQDQMIEEFLQASFDKIPVDVILRDSKRALCRVHPAGLEITPRVWWFNFENPVTGKKSKIRFERIRRIKISESPPSSRA